MADERKTRTTRSSGVLAWLHMARYVSLTNRESARRFRELGLSTAQFDVLAQLSASPGLNQQQLAKRLLVTQGNVSQLLRALERRELIRREGRGRTNLLHLTQTGTELARRAVAEHEAWLAERLAVLGDSELQQLLTLLSRLNRRSRSAAAEGKQADDD